MRSKNIKSDTNGSKGETALLQDFQRKIDADEKIEPKD